MKVLSWKYNISEKVLNWNTCLLFVSLLIFLFNQLPFLLDIRPVMYDEPWYMNPACNLLNGNGLKNTLVGSGGNVNFVAPILMAGGMAVFGESLLVSRSIAVFCGFMSVIILHLIMNELKCNKGARAFGFGIFLSISVINSTFRYVRPEFAVALFVLIGLLFSFRYYRTKGLVDMIGLSISVYLSSCSHPYSLYLFALVGCSLLLDVISTKDWKRISHMALLIMSALGVILSLIYVNKVVNHSVDSSGITQRFSTIYMVKAMMVSMKYVFLKHGAYTIPFLLINIYSMLKFNECRWLILPNLIFILTFPVFFSSDLNMVGCSVLYYTLVSIVICCYVANKMFFDLNSRKQLILSLLAICFCLGNFGISTIFNYCKRYEKCNSILVTEIDKIIPDNSLIFGSIRFWPFKMNGTWYCEVNRKKNVPDHYEYLILSSQDEAVSGNYGLMKQVLDKKYEYEQIYLKQTKQYGVITIWRYKNLYEHTIP